MVSILEQKKLQVRVFLLVGRFIFQGRLCQTFQRPYGTICGEKSASRASQSRLLHLQVSPISDQGSPLLQQLSACTRQQSDPTFACCLLLPLQFVLINNGPCDMQVS